LEVASCPAHDGPGTGDIFFWATWEETTCMVSSAEVWEGDDDLARQRRKRDARLLDEHLVDHPALTIADVVAEVLAASDAALQPLDVRTYLASEGHHWRTIEAVVAFMQRNYVRDGAAVPDQLRLL
jgi:hypothetical protein